MGRVIIDMSPSLDGFIAGAGVFTERPFGKAGLRLHRWLGLDGGRPEDADRQAAARMFETTGAIVLGRCMFDVGIAAWGEDGAFERPCFVVTHHPRESLVRGRTTFHFTDASIPAVIARARQVAGGREVLIPGGAHLARQCLASGLVDEVRLHVVPVLLGDGVRLFDDAPPGMEFELLDASTSRNATHLVYAIRPQSAANAALNVALGRIAADTFAMSAW